MLFSRFQRRELFFDSRKSVRNSSYIYYNGNVDIDNRAMIEII